MFCTFGGRDRSGGLRGRTRAPAALGVLQAREPVARCVGLQGCLRGPGVPPPPAEPRPFPGSRCLSPRPARGPPPEPLAEPRGEHGAIRAPALAARGPQVANRSVRRTPQLKFPQATPFSAARPSPRPASAQDLRRPQAPQAHPLFRQPSQGSAPATWSPHSRTPLPQTRPPGAGVGRARLPNAGRERQRRASKAGGLPRTPIAFPSPGLANLTCSTCRRFLSRRVRKDCVRATRGSAENRN